MPKSTRKFDFIFEETHITHFGGMWLIQRFCKRLQLRRKIQCHIHFFVRNQNYHTSELILALIFIIIVGLRRINKTIILKYNGAFLDMLGLDRFPDQTTFRRFLKHLPPKVIQRIVRLHDSLRAYLFSVPEERTSLVFDIDTVVMTVYGSQERSRVGYNPKKPGRRSYQAMLCYEAYFREFWHGSLRPGNTTISTGLIHFIKVCLSKVPKTIARSRIRFRIDSGCYGSPAIRFLDGTGCGYAIVAKQYPTIKRKAQACSFTRMKNGWETGEFYAKVNARQKKEHRFVVIRFPIEDTPKEEKQLEFFKDKKYVYHVFVTNLNLSPWRIYLFYRQRAIIEKDIRELLYDFPMGKIPTDSWTANVAFFQLILFAANIVHWFKRLCLPPEYLTKTLETIRTDFIVIPAKLTRDGSRNLINLPQDFHYKKEFLQAYHNICNLQLPEKFRFCKWPAKYLRR